MEAQFQNIVFDDIITRLNTRDFDILMSAMSITVARQKDIEFVPYFTAWTGILVPKGNPKQVKTFNDLCGLKVSAQFQAIQEDQLKPANDGPCKGKPVTILTFETNPQSMDELKAGRGDAQLADSPVTVHDTAESNRTPEAVDVIYEPLPYGIGVRKGSPELKAALERAMQDIRADETYDRILTKWGLTAGALK